MNKQMIVLIGVVVASVALLASLPGIVKRSGEGGPKVTPLPTKPQIEQRLFTSLGAFASKSEVAVGETFTITITITTRDNLVNGAQLELSYDPSVISVTEIAPGDFFAKPVEYAKKIDEKAGEITYAAGSFAEKKGTGVVATLEARARKKTDGLSEVLTIKNTTASHGS